MNNDFLYVKNLFSNIPKNINNDSMLTYNTKLYLYFIYNDFIIQIHKFFDSYTIFKINNNIITHKYKNYEDFINFIKQYIPHTFIEKLENYIKKHKNDIVDYLYENIDKIQDTKNQQIINLLYNYLNKKQSDNYKQLDNLINFIDGGSNKDQFNTSKAKFVGDVNELFDSKNIDFSKNQNNSVFTNVNKINQSIQEKQTIKKQFTELYKNITTTNNDILELKTKISKSESLFIDDTSKEKLKNLKDNLELFYTTGIEELALKGGISLFSATRDNDPVCKSYNHDLTHFITGESEGYTSRTCPFIPGIRGISEIYANTFLTRHSAQMYKGWYDHKCCEPFADRPHNQKNKEFKDLYYMILKSLKELLGLSLLSMPVLHRRVASYNFSFKNS